MKKGLTLKIFAIILISGVGIMFGGYIDIIKVNPTVIYTSVKKNNQANEKLEVFKEVEEFKDYDKKDTGGMQKIDMSKYSVYIPESVEFKNPSVKNKIYYNKSIKFTCSLNESRKPENLLADFPDSIKSTLKKTYGKDPNSFYDSLYLFYALQSENAKEKDLLPQAFYELVGTVDYKNVWSYDNGKIKGIISKIKSITSKRKGIDMYHLDVFSKDETENVSIIITSDYDTMCKVVNSIEFK